MCMRLCKDRLQPDRDAETRGRFIQPSEPRIGVAEVVARCGVIGRAVHRPYPGVQRILVLPAEGQRQQLPRKGQPRCAGEQLPCPGLHFRVSARVEQRHHAHDFLRIGAHQARPA